MRVGRRLLYGLHIPATLLAAALLPGCGGSNDTPTAGTSPTPIPTAAPTPTPVPTPNLPGMASCSKLPLGTEAGTRCDMSGPTQHELLAWPSRRGHLPTPRA